MSAGGTQAQCTRAGGRFVLAVSSPVDTAAARFRGFQSLWGILKHNIVCVIINASEFLAPSFGSGPPLQTGGGPAAECTGIKPNFKNLRRRLDRDPCSTSLAHSYMGSHQNHGPL